MCFLLQVTAAEEPVGPLLLDWTLVGQLAGLAPADEEGAVHPASRGRPLLDGLCRFYQVGLEVFGFIVLFSEEAFA